MSPQSPPAPTAAAPPPPARCCPRALGGRPTLLPAMLGISWDLLGCLLCVVVVRVVVSKEGMFGVFWGDVRVVYNCNDVFFLRGRGLVFV